MSFRDLTVRRMDMSASIQGKRRAWRNGDESGFALILVLVIILALTTLGIGVIYTVTTDSALSHNLLRSTQAFNLAESGGMVAYREFINSGFLTTTHTLNKEESVEEGDRLPVSIEDIEYDTESGDYVWEWDTSKSYDPFIPNTEESHGYRFRVYYQVPEKTFVLECESHVGTLTKRVRLRGRIETMFQFSYFSARDLGEFVRGADQTLTGKIHSNEDLYVRPSGSTLTINSDSFTAAKKIIRTRDAWGRPDTGGTVEISKDEQDSGTYVVMDPGSPRGTEGAAFDSDHPGWSDRSTGVIPTWGGVVQDKMKFKSPPPVFDMEPGGYYENSADLVIDDASHALPYVEMKTFWNMNEQLDENYWEIDISEMINLAVWPANGLIYAKVPVRLVNADSLANKLMFVSSRNIYTHGNLNTSDKKGAAIMTMHRIYHLSALYDDVNDHSKPTASDTWLNAALIDGAPTVDEYNWADRDGDHNYDWSGGPIYDNWEAKTEAGFNSPSPSSPWANVDDLLEDWSGKHLYKHGSVVHLCSATMAENLDNDGIDEEEELAWVKRNNYNAPTRHYSYDPDLGETDSQPPFTPLIGHLFGWEPY